MYKGMQNALLEWSLWRSLRYWNTSCASPMIMNCDRVLEIWLCMTWLNILQQCNKRTTAIINSWQYLKQPCFKY
jgi:hypothetical protein